MRSSKSEDQLSGYEEVREAAKWENEPNNDSQLYAADGDSGEELVTSSCLTLLESQMRPRVSTKLNHFMVLVFMNFPALECLFMVERGTKDSPSLKQTTV